MTHKQKYNYRYNSFGELFRKSPEGQPEQFSYKTKEWRFTPTAADVYFGYDYSYFCSQEFALKLIENGGNTKMTEEYFMDSKQLSIKFAEWCKSNIDLNQKHYAEPYESLGPCILDCIYSLRAKYFSVTVPLVKRYGETYMNGHEHDVGYTLTDFIDHINQAGGAFFFARDILNNMQVIGKKLKSEICLELAQKLVKIGIETLDDFQNKDKDFVDFCMRSVYGMGDAAVNYMFMLAGDQNRVKPDVHIHRSIREATGYEVSNDDCQNIYKLAVDILKQDYPNLTIARLDRMVWSKFRVGQK